MRVVDAWPNSLIGIMGILAKLRSTTTKRMKDTPPVTSMDMMRVPFHGQMLPPELIGIWEARRTATIRRLRRSVQFGQHVYTYQDEQHAHNSRTEPDPVNFTQFILPTSNHWLQRQCCPRHHHTHRRKHRGHPEDPSPAIAPVPQYARSDEGARTGAQPNGAAQHALVLPAVLQADKVTHGDLHQRADAAASNSAQRATHVQPCRRLREPAEQIAQNKEANADQQDGLAAKDVGQAAVQDLEGSLTHQIGGAGPGDAVAGIEGPRDGRQGRGDRIDVQRRDEVDGGQAEIGG